MLSDKNVYAALGLDTGEGRHELVLGSTFAGTRVILESLWILNHPALIVDSPSFYMYITQVNMRNPLNAIMQKCVYHQLRKKHVHDHVGARAWMAGKPLVCERLQLCA